MLIGTWNVNSIRTRLDQVLDWVEEVNPDLLCLQETKVEDQFFPYEAFESKGLKAIFHGQKSYNGVAFISRHQLEDIRTGLNGELKNNAQALELSKQSRVISALIEGIRVVNVYVPNGSELDSEKYLYKLEWLSCLKKYLETQSKRNEPLCLLGDFNIAPQDIDIHDPEKLKGKLMASKEERTILKNLLGQRLSDVFRVFESASNHWSWWDYRSSAWARDKGWRIDQIYLCETLINNAKSCQIHKNVRGLVKPSDHAPVVVEINWPAIEEEDFLPDFYS
tara:strand:+ start:1073 stop:1909 length:837 start_codon:yes stop_codon:yes gene_type:complete